MALSARSGHSQFGRSKAVNAEVDLFGDQNLAMLDREEPYRRWRHVILVHQFLAHAVESRLGHTKTVTSFAAFAEEEWLEPGKDTWRGPDRQLDCAVEVHVRPAIDPSKGGEWDLRTDLPLEGPNGLENCRERHRLEGAGTIGKSAGDAESAAKPYLQRLTDRADHEIGMVFGETQSEAPVSVDRLLCAKEEGVHMLDLVLSDSEDTWDLAATLSPMLEQHHAIEQDVIDEAQDVCEGEGSF